ncbi:hypothetical protein [Streptomyces albidus (ex Kaewkla and Franco 2022)]|uniref:hypothetical protein n=1 Tax=Streptomyces albidus (ex Kaewkla and Franco 2022) TaxID=722709 RepID=UPI0015EF5E08|nr:hypothetical protein [Streptomyces albidus (ex Kaewkla and Franco 2022)]
MSMSDEFKDKAEKMKREASDKMGDKKKNDKMNRSKKDDEQNKQDMPDRGMDEERDRSDER